MPTPAMRVKSLFMAGRTGFHINPRLTFHHLCVIGSVALLTTNASLCMGTPLPLTDRSRSLFAVTRNALFSLQIARTESKQCRNSQQ